jgi:hypothetical protein
MMEPASRSSLLWRYWVDVMGTMARANAGLYSLEPNGVSGSASPVSGSIADATGGEVFRNTSDITRLIDIVRRDTGNYYLLGYWPSASKKRAALDRGQGQQAWAAGPGAPLPWRKLVKSSPERPVKASALSCWMAIACC